MVNGECECVCVRCYEAQASFKMQLADASRTSAMGMDPPRPSVEKVVGKRRAKRARPEHQIETRKRPAYDTMSTSDWVPAV
jgi:hypothetical protein